MEGKKMWAFDLTGWHEIEDIFASIPEGQEWEETLKKAGYSGHPDFTTGGDASTVYDIHNAIKSDVDYRFLADVTVGGVCHQILVRDFPSLIELSAKVAPLVSLQLKSDEMQDKYEKEYRESIRKS